MGETQEGRARSPQPPLYLLWGLLSVTLLQSLYGQETYGQGEVEDTLALLCTKL